MAIVKGCGGWKFKEISPEVWSKETDITIQALSMENHEIGLRWKAVV